jgi:hypothetical protein
MRFRAADLRRHGWAPPQTLQIPDWCGCSTEYLPLPEGDGWWRLIPIWEPAQAPNPLRRWEPAVPYWAADRTSSRVASHAGVAGSSPASCTISNRGVS